MQQVWTRVWGKRCRHMAEALPGVQWRSAGPWLLICTFRYTWRGPRLDLVDAGPLVKLLGRQPGFQALWRRSVSQRAEVAA